MAAWSVRIAAARRCGARVGLPHTDVDEHVRVEAGDGLDDPFVLVGMNPVKHRTMQAAPRRIGVDSRQLTDPRFVLEQSGDRGAELPAHAAHEHPFPTHHHER